MENLDLLNELHEIIADFEKSGMIAEAEAMHDVFIRVAAQKTTLKPWVLPAAGALGLMGAGLLHHGDQPQPKQVTQTPKQSQPSIPPRVKKTIAPHSNTVPARPEDTKMYLNFIGNAEGGYSNDPTDKGGKTKFGITQSEYHEWLKNQHKKGKCLNYPTSIKHITHEIANHIITSPDYKLKSPDIKRWSGLALLDGALLQGLPRQVMQLQNILGVSPTGHFGHQTEEALKKWYQKYPGNIGDIKLYKELTRRENLHLQSLGDDDHIEGWENRLHNRNKLVEEQNAEYMKEMHQQNLKNQQTQNLVAENDPQKQSN